MQVVGERTSECNIFSCATAYTCKRGHRTATCRGARRTATVHSPAPSRQNTANGNFLVPRKCYLARAHCFTVSLPSVGSGDSKPIGAHGALPLPCRKGNRSRSNRATLFLQKSWCGEQVWGAFHTFLENCIVWSVSNSTNRLHRDRMLLRSVTVSCVSWPNFYHFRIAIATMAAILLRWRWCEMSVVTLFFVVLFQIGFPMGEQGRESRLTVFCPVSLFLSPINPLEQQRVFSCHWR